MSGSATGPPVGRSIQALAHGGTVGAIVAGLVVILVQLLDAPVGFPSSVAAFPSPVVPPTATPFIRGDFPIVLGPDGIGFVTFGEDEGPVLDRLTGALGLPNEDETFDCPDPAGKVRSVRWADLTAFFMGSWFAGYLDGIHFPNDGTRLELATREGVGIGATRGELQDAYDGRVTYTPAKEDYPGDVDEYRIDDGALAGLVEGAGETAVVITVRAGLGCFPVAP